MQGRRGDLKVKGLGEGSASAGQATMGQTLRTVGVAGEGDQGLVGASAQQVQQVELGRVELVEAIHDQQREIGEQFRLLLQRDGGQPALPLGIDPAVLDQPGLVGGVEAGQLGQTRTLTPTLSLPGRGSQGAFEVFGENAGAFQLLEQLAQQMREAGRGAQGGIVGDLIGVAQRLHQVADQAVADGGRETGQALTLTRCQRQYLSVEAVEGLYLDAERAAGLG